MILGGAQAGDLQEPLMVTSVGIGGKAYDVIERPLTIAIEGHPMQLPEDFSVGFADRPRHVLPHPCVPSHLTNRPPKGLGRHGDF